VSLNWNRSRVKAMTAESNVIVPDIILVIELSVVVIKGIWDLWPVIKQIIELIKKR
jgi:hypothetical protein